MGSFYGNITNTSRTQFQFDKIYPNRYEMDRSATRDGVYLGRYVLVEYDDEYHLDTFIRVQIKNGRAYYNPIGGTGYVTLLTRSMVDKGEIIYQADETLTPETGLAPTHCKFYQITSDLEEGSSDPATFVAITTVNNYGYTANYNIDLGIYAKDNNSRGYDSTVWQKVYTDGIEKYVMIAELNTVVPTFEVSSDAPTMSPIVPHFDTRSTDVYYKLHWQAPWGFRIAQADSEDVSDAKTGWTRHVYDEVSGITTTEYYNGTEWVTTPINKNLNAAIYFNRAAFNPNDTSIKRIGAYKEEDNIIKITPTGISGQKYNLHNGSFEKGELPDTQELTIHLPEIGNMMSDAWDIIHGPFRNDEMRQYLTDNEGNRLDEDGNKCIESGKDPFRIDSLQGRLDSIAAIAGDEIPVKRHDNGQLIGSKINGGKTDEDDKTGINDDAWIETIVDAATNTISIHHKFNRTKNGNTFTDLREAEDWGHDTKDSIDMNTTGDNFDIVTPIIDDMGHVVGENTQIVTLPYGFKTISIAEESEYASGVAAAAGNVVADNTQDTLTLAPGNKWIHIGASDFDNIDEITLSHEVNIIEKTNKPSTNLNDGTDTITIQDTQYDNAGHVTHNQEHTYTLPYGYKTIKTNGEAKDNNANIVEDMATNSESTSANNTQDTLNINVGNKWLHSKVENNTITFAHEVNDINTSPVADNTNLNTKVNNVIQDDINIPDWTYDNAGHIIAKQDHKYTLPFGYKTFSGDSGTTSADNTQDTMSITGDSWVQTKVSEDKIELSHIGPVAVTAVKLDDITPKFGETFDIIDWYYDANGHKSSNNTHTVKIPLPSLKNGTGNVVTGLVLNAAEGALTETKNNISNLLLTDYSKKTNSEEINSTDALGDALSKLQTQIHIASDNLAQEKSRAETAEAEILQDAKTYTDTVKNNLLGDGIKDTFNTLVEIQNWIEGDGVNTTELTQAIADEATARTNAINALGSAAYREEVYFVSKTQYDLDMSTKDAQINGLNAEAKRLTNENINLANKVNELITRIEVLESKLNPAE